MFKKIKKACTKAGLLSAAGWIILGAALFVPLIMFFYSYRPFHKLTLEEVYDGQKACIEFRVVGGPFVSTTLSSTHDINGIYKVESPKEIIREGYLVQIEFADTPKTMFMAVMASNRRPFEISRFEKSYYDRTTLRYYGTFMYDTEIRNYMEDFLRGQGFPAIEVNAHAMQCGFETGGAFPWVQAISAVIGYALIILGIIQIAKALHGNNYHRFEQDIRTLEFSEREFEIDLAYARQYDLESRLQISHNYTYLDMFGRRPRVIANERVEAVSVRVLGALSRPRIPVLLKYTFTGEERTYKIRIVSDTAMLENLQDEYQSLGS